MLRHSIVWLLAIVALPGLALQAGPTDTRAGDFVFQIPAGWNRVDKDHVIFLFAPATSTGTVTFIGLATGDLDTDLRKSFDELWRGFTASYKILQGGQTPVPAHSPNGYEALTMTALAADQSGKQFNVFVMGAQYQKHVEAVMFMSSAFDPQLSAGYQSTFNTFLSGLRFGNDNDAPSARPPAGDSGSASGAGAVNRPAREVPHKLPPGALEGVYVGFSIDGNGRAGLRRLHFNPDGWVVKDILPESMIGFDFTAYRNSPDVNKSWVGRYRVNGNEINIVWQDYAEDREVITRNENSASPGMRSYVPMCFCTGKRFSGKYIWGLANSGQYLQFFPDGTFIDRGVTDQMIVPSNFYEHPRTLRGTYSIESQTLIFTFADGRRATRSFIAPKAQENGPVFDWIGLGWHTLYEEHHQSNP